MLFLTVVIFSIALAASMSVILLNISGALPRIAEVIEAEFVPAPHTQRRISFGAVKHHQVARTADVVAFPTVRGAEQEFKLAA